MFVNNGMYLMIKKGIINHQSFPFHLYSPTSNIIIYKKKCQCFHGANVKNNINLKSLFEYIMN